MRHTVLAVVVAYIAMIVTAAASLVNFVSAGVVKLFLDQISATPSRTIAATTCKENGGILLADYAPAVQQMYMEPFVNAGASYLCQSTGYGWSRNCYGAYTEGQATAGPCTLRARENVFSLAFDPATEAKMCPYRWSLGWFGRYTNNLGQVGVNFYDSAWADLAFDGTDKSKIPSASDLRNYERMVSDTSTQNIYAGGPANDYDDGVMWNASFQRRDGGSDSTMAACIPPHGNPFVALGARQLSVASGGFHGVRGDAPEVPTSIYDAVPNTPFAPNHYVVACQWQGVEASYYASTTLPPQYPIVQGWKDPSWAQTYWWVIYLIIAVVLLTLLVAFIVWYECQLCAAKSADDDDTDAGTDVTTQSDATGPVTQLHGRETVVGLAQIPARTEHAIPAPTPTDVRGTPRHDDPDAMPRTDREVVVTIANGMVRVVEVPTTAGAASTRSPQPRGERHGQPRTG